MADTPRKNWFARALDAAASTETNPLALAWRALPPNVRATYASLPNAVAELSPGAAIRDTVQASGETANAALQGRGWDAAGGVANMLTAAAGVVPGGKLLVKGAKAVNPIRAYHGSPHDFDRFDMSKIGTGEGAQAYGHGLYFAENEAIARDYRKKLATHNWSLDGKPLPPTEKMGAWGAASLSPADMKAAGFGGSDEELRSLAFLATRADFDDAVSKLREMGKPDRAAYLEALRGRLEVAPGGKMYEVNIHADPAKFLDWDKPLRDQTPEVNAAIGKFGGSPEDIRAAMAMYEARTNLPGPRGDMARESLTKLRGQLSLADAKTGGAFYESPGVVSGPYRDPVAASNALRDAGIPGIKYLDGGSRAAGDGSRNYVAFDDKLIEILRKYGLLPVAAGGAAVAANPLSTGEEGAY